MHGLPRAKVISQLLLHQHLYCCTSAPLQGKHTLNIKATMLKGTAEVNGVPSLQPPTDQVYTAKVGGGLCSTALTPDKPAAAKHTAKAETQCLLVENPAHAPFVCLDCRLTPALRLHSSSDVRWVDLSRVCQC